MGRFFVWDTETYCRYYWQCYGLEASKLVSLAYPPQYGKLSSSDIRENEVYLARIATDFNPIWVRARGRGTHWLYIT